MKIKAGIIGAAGYTGGETIRLLLHHPNVELQFAQSHSMNGKHIYEVHKDLIGEINLRFVEEVNLDVDVLFLCGGYGKAKEFMMGHHLPDSLHIVDLSHDFRLNETKSIQNKMFDYGLPEINRDQIAKSKYIANPGCFATAIQLGLLPLASKKLLKEVYTTGITGSTGAGQALSESTHFSWRNNNVQAYKSLTHQHVFEIKETLYLLNEDEVSLNFIPWRGDFTRGIYVSSVLTCDQSLGEVESLFTSYYKNAAFTHLSNTPIDLKQVVNTNKCLIYLEKEGNKLVVHTVIDNLLKGASGQAIQNMNLMFGLEEKAGLQLKSNAF